MRLLHLMEKHISYQCWWCTLYAELLLGMEFWDKFGIVPKIEVAAIKSEGTTAVNVQGNEHDYGKIEDVLAEETEDNANEEIHVLSAEQRARLDQVNDHIPAAKEGKMGMTNVLTHNLDTDNAVMCSHHTNNDKSMPS
jgi:hypothetical protein